MQVWFPEQTQVTIPTWMKMIAGLVSLLAGTVMLYQHPLDFMWVPQLCLGIWFLFVMPPLRRPGESRRDYYKRPRVLLSSFFVVTAIIGSLRNLVIVYRR